MKNITLTEENLKALLTNVYNTASIQTENHILENPDVEFDLKNEARELVNRIVETL